MRLCSPEVWLAGTAIPTPRRCSKTALVTTLPTPTPLLDPAAEEVLRGIRDRRFADGIHCPHCGHDDCIGWGSFSGRQRYRCRGCRRTFSDLTGTALMYTKRLACWREYLIRFREAQTLRRAAAALDIHVSTAFRWRHRILRATRRNELAPLTSWIELFEFVLAASNKGTRQPPGLARRRGARLTSIWTETARARSLLARDRRGLLRSFPLETRIVAADELHAHFSNAFAPHSTLLLAYRNPAPYLTAARRAGLRVVPLGLLDHSDRRLHVRHITAYARRLYRWLLRFRGIATYYREHYFAWHRLVDGDTETGWLHGCFGHVVPPPRPPPASS